MHLVNNIVLSYMTAKIVSEMTYNVSSETLNPTVPYHTIPYHTYSYNSNSFPVFIMFYK